MLKKCKRLFAGLLSCILILSSMTVYAEENVTADTQEEQQYTLTVKAENGNVTISGDGVTQTGQNTYTVLSGTSVTVKTDPVEGYETAEIKLNDVDINWSDNIASFEMPSQDSSLDVMFSEIPEPENQETVETEEKSDEETSDSEKEESDITETGENTDADTNNESVSDEEEKDEIVGESSTGTTVESIETGQTDDKVVEEKEESATTESAAEEKVKEQYDITFRVHGNGTVKLEYQDQEPVTVAEDESTTLSLDVDTYIRVTAESEEETNISMAVTNKEGIELEPPITERSTSYTREITVTETEKVVDISFSDSVLNNILAPRLLAASARGTEAQPEVGDRFTGQLTVVSVDGGDGHTVHGVTIRATSGILQGEGTFTVDCAQHSAAAPTAGMTYSYTYTITSVDESTGRVAGNLYGISNTQPSDGVTTDGNGNLIGYQAISGTIYITREFNGSLNLLKTSANTEITSGNSNYSLSGAVYGVYTDRSCTDRVATLTTTESGESNTVDITAGQYYVKEITAPKGYALDTTVHSVTVTAGQTATVRVTDYPQSDPVSIILGKIDAETTANMPQGSASLEGAEFTVKYYDDMEALESGRAIRTWVLKTNSAGRTAMTDSLKVSGDDFYKNSNGYNTLPLGYITIQETKAPEGYLLNDEVFVRQITAEGTAEGVNTYNEPTIPEDIIRGDLELVKFGEPEDAEEDQMIPLEGIVFEITSKTTGETVEITTDSHGFASTEQLGISDRGNLVYDTYVVHEKNTPAGYDPVDDFEVTISEEGQTLYYILEDKQILSPVQLVKVDSTTGQTIPIADTEFQLLDADKNPISMTTYYPSEEVHETFKTDATGAFTLPEKLPAGVYYFRELNAPEGYLLNGEDLRFEITESYDWDEPLVVNFEDAPAMGRIEITKTDSDEGYPLAGAEFTVTAAEDIVTPDGTVRATAGEVVDTITTGYDGIGQSTDLFLGKYTVTESKQPSGYVLSDQSWNIELTYQDQNTAIVTESLEATNAPTKITIEKIETGTDKHLAGVQFEVWNKAMVDDEVDPEFAVKETYTTDENGMINLERLQPGTYCVQEVSTIDGYVLNDTIYEFTVSEDGRIDGQDTYTLSIENDKERNPQLHTTAIDLESGTHEAIAKEDITIRDTVDYTDVAPGTYTLVGILMDQSTGEPLLVNGEQVTAEKEVQITEENGTLTMDFTFDASELGGTSTVVFEYLYPGNQDNHEDTPYASHEDINDGDQTVSFKERTPQLHTTAIDLESGTHEAIAKEDVTIRDYVDYTDVEPGTYTLVGILMDQSTGEPLLVNGEQVTAEKEVQITEENGTLTMDFTFDASELNGTSTVVFEYLYPGNQDNHEDTPYASHEDINDENQTVSFKVGSLTPFLPNQSGSGMNAPQTGDNTTIYYVLGMMCIAAGVGVATYVIRKRKKVNEIEK